MLELVNLLPDRQFYCDEVLNSLPHSGDDWDAVQRFHFATHMAFDGDERAKRLLNTLKKETLGEIVGIAAETRASMTGTPPLMSYRPYWTNPQSGCSLAIRAAQDPAAVAGAVRSAIWSRDSGLPIPEMKKRCGGFCMSPFPSAVFRPRCSPGSR